MTPADTLFHSLADPTRLRSMVLLVLEGELCVCELTHALGESQPKVSRHLAQLRESGLVADRRAGQWVYYRLNPALPAWVKQVLTVTVEAIASETRHRHDLAQLGAMPNRPGAHCRTAGSMPAISTASADVPGPSGRRADHV